MQRWRSLLLTTTALLAAGPALAGPDGGTVVGGSATITGQGSATVTINQTSNRAIINWQQFNIGAGELTQFNQPGSSSVALNRVTGGLGPSEILGTLRANGRVFVVNRDGIYFGPNAVVDTAGFLATTSDIRNDDFMAGRYNFNIPGRPDASIVNQGVITAHNAGFAALVAPGVRNTGTITATLGTVGLAAGNTFTLDLYGDKLITLAVGDQIAAEVRDVHTGLPLSSLVENAGRINANGGRVELTAAAARRVVDSVINNSGVIEANSIGTRGGEIVLSAATADSKPAGAPPQTVRIGGTLSAAGKKSGEKGGKIVVQGENIQVSGARIDVSGRAGGGTVLIGGDWGGGTPDQSLVANPSARLESQRVRTAATVTVDSGTTINASATESGNGGKVILWADERMSFSGAIAARGGPNGGDGGFVEVSGKHNLSYLGTVDLRAPSGSAGTLLLDPTSITIWSGDGEAPLGSTITRAKLEDDLAASNVVISTNSSGEGLGNITVASGFTWGDRSNNSLTLAAHNDITVNENATITNVGAGNLTLRADSDGNNAGTINLQGSSGARINFSSSTGRVDFYYNPSDGYYNPENFSSLVQTNNPNQFTAYMLVNNLQNLQDISQNLNGNYALGGNIDANMMEGTFAPLGTFYGRFDGLNHTISNLYIAPTDYETNSIGLFARIGSGASVSNLNLDNVTVFANPNVEGPGQFVGTLAGQNFGTIRNVTVTQGRINGVPDSEWGNISGLIAGGLVGQNGSPIQEGPAPLIANSRAEVNVVVGNGTSGTEIGGWNYAGGFVGRNYGAITGSTAGNNLPPGPVISTNNLPSQHQNTVVGGFNSFVGGFVGQNDGTINNSVARTAAGGVTGSAYSEGEPSSTAVGGFVGANSGNIANSTAKGPVGDEGTAGTIILGGFVGLNGLNDAGLITNSQATGAVVAIGKGQVGGFVGGNFAEIRDSSAAGDVSIAQGTAGGFVGFNSVQAMINASHANGHVTGSPATIFALANLGGFVGENQGAITNAYATGNVAASVHGSLGVLAGGFAGINQGSIADSHATRAVSVGGQSAIGHAFVVSGNEGTSTEGGSFTLLGGFVGSNEGVIENSYSIGNVTANGGGFVVLGGFAGANQGIIVDSYATGAVSSNRERTIAGGFVGFNLGLVGTSYANGNVNIADAQLGYGGGFAGWNIGAIAQSFATGAVSGGNNSFVGGFAAVNLGVPDQGNAIASVQEVPQSDNTFAGLISQSYATGAVTGGANSFAGGLVALNLGHLDQTYAIGRVTGGAGSTSGGLVAANGFNAFTGLPPDAPQIPGSLSEGTATNSYWNTQTTGQSTSRGGSPLTTAEMTSTLPAGFNPTVWSKNATSYPFLKVQPPTTIPPDPQQTPQDPQYPQNPQDPQNPDPQTGNPPPQQNPQIAGTQSLLLQVANLIFQGNTQPSIPGEVVTPPEQDSQGGQGNNGRGGSRDGPNGTTGPLRPDGRPSNIPPINETRFINDQVMVQIGANVSPEVLDRIVRRLGLTVLSSQTLALLGTRVIQFQFGGGKTIRDVIRELEKLKIVDEATPNYEFEMAQDMAGSAQTLNGDPAQYIIEKLQLAAAHRIATGQNVKIAVIDSEIDARHPDIEGRVAARYEEGDPVPPHSHGTGMAGAIVSHRKLMGTAPGARILAIRAFGGASGGKGTTLQIVKGLDWAISQGAQIVNMSFAGPKDPTLAKAFKAARDKGVVLIAAAGNAGPKSPPLYPGADPNVMAVSATDADDQIYANSNRGKYVSVAAPGVEVLVPAPDGNYEFTTGTSVAAAHVSGVAALLLQRDPKLDADGMREILTSTANPLGTKGRTDDFGYGRIDPLKALQAVDAKTAGRRAPTALATAGR
jgi:filamentous hemagglutinin family protein